MPAATHLSLAALSFTALMLTTSNAKADFTFFSFSDVSSLQINGDAQQAGDALQLSSATSFSSGSAFTRSAVSLGNQNSFSTYFQFRILNSGGITDSDGIGADGLVFVVQTVANNVGGAGGQIGYGGITNSVGIEFDTWNNSLSFGDPDGNHVGIDIDGNIASVAVAPEPTRFNNGLVWNAWVDYNGATDGLEIRWSTLATRPVSSQLSRTVDLVSILGGDTAFVGFTSGTGSAWGDHQILSWSYVGEFAPIPSIPEPSTYGLLIIGGIFIAAAIRRRKSEA